MRITMSGVLIPEVSQKLVCASDTASGAIDMLFSITIAQVVQGGRVRRLIFIERRVCAPLPCRLGGKALEDSQERAGPIKEPLQDT